MLRILLIVAVAIAVVIGLMKLTGRGDVVDSAVEATQEAAGDAGQAEDQCRTVADSNRFRIQLRRRGRPRANGSRLHQG